MINRHLLCVLAALMTANCKPRVNESALQESALSEPAGCSAQYARLARIRSGQEPMRFPQGNRHYGDWKPIDSVNAYYDLIEVPAKFGLPTIKDIEKYISGTPGKGRLVSNNVVELFKKSPKDGTPNKPIIDLFRAPSYVWEEYTVEEHTRNVIDVFNSQRRYYRFPQKFDAYPLFVYALAMHDIGKSVSGLMGDTSCQHQYTVDIMKAIFPLIGFDKQQIALAISLVDHDLFGSYAKGELRLESAVRQLEQVYSNFANTLSFQRYLVMQKLFYISDSNSYPVVADRFFTTVGRMGFGNGKSEKIEHGSHILYAFNCALQFSDGEENVKPSEGPDVERDLCKGSQ